MMNAPDSVWEAAASVWAKSNVAVAHRLARPEEIAAAALMMASDEFTFMNGAQIVVDGGKTPHAGGTETAGLPQHRFDRLALIRGPRTLTGNGITDVIALD